MSKSLLEISAHLLKHFHFSTYNLRTCANNPALEDFVIQNHYQEFLRLYAKTFHVSAKNLRTSVGDFAIQFVV